MKRRPQRLPENLALLALGLMPVVGMPAAEAGELIHQPINPSFGGSPLNGNFLLNSAEVQNHFTNPVVSSTESNRNLDTFTRGVERQVLSLLSRRIIDEAFGTSGLTTEGVFSTDEFSVEVVNTDPTKVVVHITDNLTSESTTIELPKY